MINTQEIITVIEQAIRRIYDRSAGYIPLHAPCFRGREWEYVKECLDTGWVSSVGQYVDKFERAIADYTGAQYAVATVNGTAAIHIALLLSGVEPDDEVLCPAFSFVATISAIVYCSAHPVFMDSDKNTLGMDPEKVERFLSEKCIKKTNAFTYNRKSGRRVRACIPMHTYGYPIEMDSILRVCEEYNIAAIEDAAEALGSYYDGRHCGTMSRFGILSFNGNKIVTTGGGGMILCNEEDLAKRARHLTTTAKMDHPWEYVHDEIGYNYRMPNLNAALGCAQIENLDASLIRKRKQAERFKRLLEGESEIRVIQPETGKGNHWFNLVRVHPEYRDDILNVLNEKGIQARASWTPICDMRPYIKYEKYEIETSRELSRSLICLPNGLIK